MKATRINSVLKAIDILQVFSSDEPVLSLAEISRRLGYPKSTVHTLINTLESRGFIERGAGNNYALGSALIPMTQAVRVNVHLRDRAAPLLRELGDYCRESVYLTVLDGNRCLYIYAIESSHRLLARTAIGDRVHLHCTSTGKAILAFLSPEEVQRIVAQAGLPAFTEHTLTTLDRLLPELEESRRRGYALDREEHELGTFCVGSPIFDEQGQVIGSCSISGPDPAIVAARLPDFSAAVRYTAQEVSRRMGFVPKPDKLLWRETANPLRPGG